MRFGVWTAAAVSLAVIAGLAVVLRPGRPPSPTAGANPLMVYCAAGIKEPIEAAIKQYEQRYGTPVELQYGGSGTLLANFKAARIGDLYVAAEQDYIDIAVRDGLVDESLPLATQRPVLAFAKSKGLKIESLASLLDPALRVGIASPDAAAVGLVSRQMLERLGLWADVERAVTERGVFKPTVPDLANDLRVGSIDVAILWDATVNQYPELTFVEIDPALYKPQHITLGVLASSENPTGALHLARYLAARDRGLLQFARRGYAVVDGDPWAERPELKVYCGGMLRLAVEQTLAEFSQREGVDISIEYNGCGILVGQIKVGARPDAYIACDTSFMTQVSDLFPGAIDLAACEMLIAVRKGNPHNIRGLADLERPGLRVGMCNPQQSALGALTDSLLKRTGHLDGVMKNIVVQVPTADLLVTQLRAGGLDAAIVYEVNFRPVADHLDKVALGDSALATQPVAVCKEATYKYLAQRLLARLREAESRERFITSGFVWRDQRLPPSSPTGLSTQGVEPQQTAVP